MGTNQSLADFNAAFEAFNASQGTSAGTVTNTAGIGGGGVSNP